MIEAVIFDLDGTLVQTEKLKALSYAQAAVALHPHGLSEDEVFEAFKDVVGLSRREVAVKLMERFDLVEEASARMDKFGVSAPWQAYAQLRLEHYDAILEEPSVIRDNTWPHAIALLHEVKKRGCRLGLATTSHREQARRVLDILELKDVFDFIATRNDVENSKPDPEIYHLVLRELGVAPEASLVIEDSPAGVEAALNAGVEVIAVSTPFTRERLHKLERLSKERIVDDPDTLMTVAERVFNQGSNV